MTMDPTISAILDAAAQPGGAALLAVVVWVRLGEVATALGKLLDRVERIESHVERIEDRVSSSPSPSNGAGHAPS